MTSVQRKSNQTNLKNKYITTPNKTQLQNQPTNKTQHFKRKQYLWAGVSLLWQLLAKGPTTEVLKYAILNQAKCYASTTPGVIVQTGNAQQFCCYQPCYNEAILHKAGLNY